MEKTSESVLAELRKRVGPPPSSLSVGQQRRLDNLHVMAVAFGAGLVDLMPPGREQAMALSALEVAVQHARTGIEREGM